MTCPECGYSGTVFEISWYESIVIRADMVAVCYDEDENKKYVHKSINEEDAPDMIVKSNTGRMVI